MPLSAYLTILVMCSMIFFAIGYTQGKKHYELDNLGKPVKLKDIIHVYGLDLFCQELTVLYCRQIESDLFLCLVINHLTQQVYYFSLDNDPGKNFTLYVKENKPNNFEVILKTSN